MFSYSGYHLVCRYFWVVNFRTYLITRTWLPVVRTMSSRYDKLWGNQSSSTMASIKKDERWVYSDRLFKYPHKPRIFVSLMRFKSTYHIIVTKRKRFHIYYRIDQMSSFNSVKVPFPYSSFYPTWTSGHASAVQAIFPIATHSIIVTITVWNRRKFVGYLNESTLLFTSNCFLWASMALSDAFCCFPDPFLYFRINFCMYNRIQAAVIRRQNTCTENSSCHESKIYFAKLVC